MQNRLMFYGILILLTISSLTALLLGNLPLLLLDSLMLPLLFTSYKLWDLIEARIMRRTKTIQLFAGYELSGDRRAAVRRMGSQYSATAAALLKGAGSSRMDHSAIEALISKLSAPFRLILQVGSVDSEKLADSLRTTLASQEIALDRLSYSRSPGSSAKASELRRKIEMLEREIRLISAGPTPLRLLHYVTSSATAESRLLAEERARSQVREVSSALGALSGKEPQLLAGSELLALLHFDSVGWSND